jgi:hypothetical protein
VPHRNICNLSTYFILDNKGSFQLSYGHAFPAIPHPGPDAQSANFDTGIGRCPIVSTADRASDLSALLPTTRAHFGSDAPVWSCPAYALICFALESSAFVQSGTAIVAQPLCKKRGSKVIARVTLKSLCAFRIPFVQTLPLQGAPVSLTTSRAFEVGSRRRLHSRWSLYLRPGKQAFGRLPLVALSSGLPGCFSASGSATSALVSRRSPRFMVAHNFTHSC